MRAKGLAIGFIVFVLSFYLIGYLIQLGNHPAPRMTTEKQLVALEESEKGEYAKLFNIGREQEDGFCGVFFVDNKPFLVNVVNPYDEQAVKDMERATFELVEDSDFTKIKINVFKRNGNIESYLCTAYLPVSMSFESIDYLQSDKEIEMLPEPHGFIYHF